LEQKLPLDGRDVWPMITQGAKSPHDAILLVGTQPTRAAVRMGDWKLLMNASEQDIESIDEKPKPDADKSAAKSSVQLYNLATDIGEKTDLAAKEPERVASMRARLGEFLKGAVTPGNAALEDSTAGKRKKKSAK
jgi:hypothetical protein